MNHTDRRDKTILCEGKWVINIEIRGVKKTDLELFEDKKYGILPDRYGNIPIVYAQNMAIMTTSVSHSFCLAFS